jgi:hypothetical protein
MSHVDPVQRLIPDAIASLLRRAPLSREKVAFAWRSVVGPNVDKVTTVDIRDGTLLVRARDAAWQREIERSSALIRSRLAEVLGPDIVRWIDVRVG